MFRGSLSCENAKTGWWRPPRFAVTMLLFLFGPQSTFLGWYANARELEKEMAEIQDALFRGVPAYELKYSVKVEWKPFGVKIKE